MVTSGRVEREWMRERGPARADESMEASARGLDNMMMLMIKNEGFWAQC
jgi:hypothetical protein